MFNVIETQTDGTIIIHDTVEEADVKRVVYNVKRRANVVGEVTAVEIVEIEEIVENNYVEHDGYISFGDAARMLGVRYQQVFQRAVTKGKMSWRQSPENEVWLQDVVTWQQKRNAQ